MQSKTTLAALTGMGTLLLATGCDLSTGPSYDSGTITDLRHEEVWIENDCTDTGDDLPSCTAEVEEDCYLVVYEVSIDKNTTFESSDCTRKADWDKLKVGDDYTDK